MLKLVLFVPGLLLFALAPEKLPLNPALQASSAAEARGTSPKPTAESIARAKKVYGYDCAMCHGAGGDGKGDVAADMKLTLKDYTDAAALKDLSDAEILEIVKNGKGQMPGEGARLKPEDTVAMVYVVRSFAKK